MDPRHATDLANALESDIGDGLRTVAVGNVSERTYDIFYIRDDIDEMYTDEMREEIFGEMVLENIAEARQNDLFPPLGRLRFTARVFEHGINVVGWDENVAVFVGLDGDEELISQAVETCRETL
ncbi:hypothetical protein [Halorussus amylolyticus]|uniref:hypothetical protein n=1 Tax=Halorussus amylolyticus TaxID=1126242 RepID=UPI00104FEC46|nr:hypothetical protein [Halorussus amylolyticus]